MVSRTWILMALAGLALPVAGCNGCSMPWDEVTEDPSTNEFVLKARRGNRKGRKGRKGRKNQKKVRAASGRDKTLTAAQRKRAKNPPIEMSAADAARMAPLPVSAAKAATAVAAPTSLPNVVVLIGCTVRRDQMTPWGAPDAVTPHIGSLASSGTVFDDLVAAAPWTRAASTAILTGYHAVSVDMVEKDAGRNDSVLPASLTTMGEHMKARGYHTIGSSTNPNLSSLFGFSAGYDVYQPGVGRIDWSQKYRGIKMSEHLLDAVDTHLASAEADKPVFIRAMMLDAHQPRATAGKAGKRFREDGLDERIVDYRYNLHQFDKAVKKLDEGLQERGLDRSNTVFVIAADHGEGMYYPDHHGWGHGNYLMPSTNHVPWIMAGPGVAQDHRVLGVASQIDIMPTLMGTIGKPLVESEKVDGTDLSAMVRGESSVTPHEAVYADTWFNESQRSAIYTPTHMCQQDWLGNDAGDEYFSVGCFDRHADPLLTTTVHGQESLLENLASWREDALNLRISDAAGSAEVDDELSEQLEALGYAE